MTDLVKAEGKLQGLVEDLTCAMTGMDGCPPIDGLQDIYNGLHDALRNAQGCLDETRERLHEEALDREAREKSQQLLVRGWLGNDMAAE